MTEDTDTARETAVISKRKKEDKEHEVPLTAREEWSEFFKTALIAVILALIIRTFLYEPFNIPSGSMKPTLEIGDYLFVHKPAYGYSRHSFPFGIAPIEGRIWTGDKVPERGDVIVFKLPTNPRVDYIKRIIGLPGETVQVIDGRLYINRHMVSRVTIGLKRVQERHGLYTTIMEYEETLPGGIKHRIYEEDDAMPLDNTREYIVPEKHYFVMGDNRDNSQDSRVQQLVGYVPEENIVGKADFIFFSTNGAANLVEFWKWPKTIRYKRLFMNIKPTRHAQE